MSSDEKKLADLDKAGQIDISTFQQILEMDDEEDEREFSKSIVFDFFEQANTTFKNMDDSLAEKDLPTLSSLGHFLKGSSATLGLTKVKDSCEKIQHFGLGKDESGSVDEPDEGVSLEKLAATIAQAKQEFQDVKELLVQFYSDS